MARPVAPWSNALLHAGFGLSLVVGSACGPGVSGGADSTSTTSTTSATPTTDEGTTATPTTTSGSSTTTGVDTVGPVDTTLDPSSGTDDPTGPCSVWAQDCPEGEKCMPIASAGGDWDDTQCVVIVDDPGQPGDPCTYDGLPTEGHDNCDGTSMCWDVDLRTNEGTCTELCSGSEMDPICSQTCDYCELTANGLFNVCRTGCDPLAPNCPPGQGCYEYLGQFVCTVDNSDVSADIGSACEFIDQCPPGLLCAPASDVPGCEGPGFCCTPVCEVGGVDPCPGLLPDSMCIPVLDPEDRPPAECVVGPAGWCLSP